LVVVDGKNHVADGAGGETASVNGIDTSDDRAKLVEDS
jgi:hypothetical protein